MRALIEEEKVDVLMDIDAKQWNLLPVKEVFSNSKAKILCKILVSPCNSLDKMLWRCTANGKFPIRNAYFLQRRKSNKGTIFKLHQQPIKLVQDMELRIPNVEKIFL